MVDRSSVAAAGRRPPRPRGPARRRATVARPSTQPRRPSQAVWARVQLARNLRRPRILEFIAEIADEFVELHGDRLFGDDEAVVAGFARIEGRRVVVVGQQKGADTEENVRRNFGMPHPEGYRKAMRVMELAERSGLPVVTFVDVPGAHPGPESEERGIAEAIARSVGLMTRLRTPIVTVITGEGGSGGALAIAVGDVVLALENAVYSVISPEGCASILWRTADEAPTAALAMRMSAIDQQRLGVIDEVIAEPPDGAQADPAETARRLKAAIIRELDRLAPISIDALVEAALSPVPFARRVHGDRGPGADPAHRPASRPGGPPAEPARGRPARDPRPAPGRPPGRTPRPRGRLAHARPAPDRRPNARPAAGGSREPRAAVRVARPGARPEAVVERPWRARGAGGRLAHPPAAVGARVRRPAAPDRAAAARLPRRPRRPRSARPTSARRRRHGLPVRRDRRGGIRGRVAAHASPRPRRRVPAPRRARRRPGSARATGSRSVDLLGIGQDVTSPIDGVVVEVFAQEGEAVEYGEEVAAVQADVTVETEAPAGDGPAAEGR